MRFSIKLLFILLAASFAACSSDEPDKDILIGYGSPFEFDYQDIDSSVELSKHSNETTGYFGEIPAEGGSFSISHEYNFFLVSKNNMYSMLKLFINNEYIKGNQVNNYVPADGIEYCGEWGSVVTRFEGRKTFSTFTFEKNETGTPRDIYILLSYTTFTANIFLTQESL